MFENYQCFLCGHHFELSYELVDHVDAEHPEANMRQEEATQYANSKPEAI